MLGLDGRMSAVRLALLVTLAMIAFAANSVLCRFALADGAIDATSFTAVRLGAGAVTLALLALLRGKSLIAAPSWPAALSLLVYMLGFSFAYRSLTTATGALVLFGCVQLTMIGVSLVRGERLPATGWLGIAAAVAGLVWLLLPGLSAPDPIGAALMAAAGIGWGAYSLLGRGNGDPLRITAQNFLIATPFVLVLLPFAEVSASIEGVLLAVASGALASGVGYAIWYAALPALSGMRAASVQLTVPVIAAIGGWLLLSEALDMRLLIASTLTLGGVAVVLRAKLA